MKQSNPLYPFAVDDANYLLRQGRATLQDAMEYCEAWNKEKVSTHCEVEETEASISNYLTVSTPVVRFPIIRCRAI